MSPRRCVPAIRWSRSVGMTAASLPIHSKSVNLTAPRTPRNWRGASDQIVELVRRSDRVGSEFGSDAPYGRQRRGIFVDALSEQALAWRPLREMQPFEGREQVRLEPSDPNSNAPAPRPFQKLLEAFETDDIGISNPLDAEQHVSRAVGQRLTLDIAVGTLIAERPPQSGRIKARTGLRMMPTFP